MRCVSCGFDRVIRAAALAALVLVPASSIGATLDAEIAASLRQSPAPEGLRLIWHDGSEDGAATMDQLTRAGFKVAIAIPPHVFYVRETGSGRAAAPTAEDTAPDLFQGRDDVLPAYPRGPIRSIARTATPHGLLFGTRWRDTSEFMIGRTAVSILFPESDGTVDPNHYDWTPALRDSVIRSAVRGLAHWTTFAARRGLDVSFALEVHAGLSTRYEPIDRPSGAEDIWIQDVLTGYLGYKSDAQTLAYNEANAVRSRLGASWGVVLFAVQDDTSPTGQFPDGAISHARLGGPYFVTPVKNAGAALGGATLDTYIEHEMAHMFWALDEHLPSSGWWACSLTTGYLNTPNYNSLVPAAGYCGTPPVQCLMKGNYPDSVCVYTQGQIGWADRDQNGTPDLLETHPAAFPDSDQYHAVAGAAINLHGHALEVPLWNQNPYEFFSGDSISLATVDSVRYSIDRGPWVSVPPADGVYDSGREYFNATIPPLPPGTYVVDWEAWNSSGIRSFNNLTTTITLRAPSSPAGSGGDNSGSPGVSLRCGPTPSAGTVRFTLLARPGSQGWATLHDVSGRLTARWLVTVPSSGLADWSWTARLAGGATLPSGLYFLSLDIGGTVLKRRLVISH